MIEFKVGDVVKITPNHNWTKVTIIEGIYLVIEVSDNYYACMDRSFRRKDAYKPNSFLQNSRFVYECFELVSR